MAPRDDRHAGEVAERRRALAFCELRAGLDEQHVRVAQHLLGLERPFGERQVGEGEVELAVLEQAEEVGRVRLLADAHLDAGPVLLEAAQETGEDARPDALVDADAQRAGGALGEGGHVGACRVELRDDRIRVAEQEPARVGEVDGARAAGADDELLADAPLETGDLLAHRRLRVAELPGGGAERARASDRLECGQVTELDAEKAITFHYQDEL